MTSCTGVFNCWRNPLLTNKVRLTLKEFSFFTGLTLRATTELVSTGEIKSIRVGRRRLIPVGEIELFALQLELFTLKELAPTLAAKSVHGKGVGR